LKEFERKNIMKKNESMRSVFEATAILLLLQFVTISIRKSSSSANSYEDSGIVIDDESLLHDINTIRRNFPLLVKTEQQHQNESDNEKGKKRFILKHICESSLL
jgi:hypothetical protein